jgi:adenylosuccinate lyase
MMVADFSLKFRKKLILSIRMDLSLLTAISPIDGRYRGKTEPLADYFSEYALIRYRVRVEIEYFIALCELPLPQLQDFNHQLFDALRDIYRQFTPADAQRVKDIERVTNHDVKAVEYFIKEKIDVLSGFPIQAKEFIHFGLTSQDINNTAVPLSIKEALADVYIPLLEELIEQLHDYAEAWKNVPMLAKTHGQPASPTRLGKEMMVFVYRLEEQLRSLKDTPVTAKFGGATGNFNAHHVAYPQYDWREFGNSFVSEKLGLEREQYTTQISNYDWLGAIFDAMRRINTIVIDLDRDFWMYISMEYFKQKIKAGEVGSSAMPHKVNPIDYENSEGNLGIANAILQFLAAKLPVSRLQRDLTDSTVLRNVGVPMGHALIAFESTLKGLRKLILNESKLQEDLDNTWAVVAEGIQTILRREGYPNPYETLKALTRTNEGITADTITAFIASLDVSESVKAELRAITPSTYTGIL